MREKIKNKITLCLQKFKNLLVKIKTIMSNNKSYIIWAISYLICLSPLLWFSFVWKYNKENAVPWIMMFSFYVLSTLIFIFALLKPNFKKDQE